MNDSHLQEFVDAFHAASRQQWVFGAIAVTAALGAVLAAAGANRELWPVGLVLIGCLAVASAIRPDTHMASSVTVVVSWHWLATVDDVGTGWLAVAALCLLVHHSVTALAASIPHGGAVGPAIVRRWVGRTLAVGGATCAMWLMVVALDGREASGNAILAASALALAGGAALAVRALSLGSGR